MTQYYSCQPLRPREPEFFTQENVALGVWAFALDKGLLQGEATDLLVNVSMNMHEEGLISILNHLAT